MKTHANLTLLLVALWLSACKQATSPPEQESTKTVAEIPVKHDYDPGKGSHIVGAGMTKMITDTLGSVMYELTMKPGDSLGWHQHPFHTVFVLEGGKLAVYFDGSEEKQIMELPTGFGMLGHPSGDAAVNVGETTVRLLTHDLYSLR